MTSGRTRPLVLVVEDDQDTRDMYAMYLDFSGMDTLLASTVPDAFALAVDRLPDIVVTDLMLRGAANGTDLCMQLHGDPRTRHIPTLLVTGSTRTATEKAPPDGCAQIRVKPYLPDALVADIKEILGRA